LPVSNPVARRETIIPPSCLTTSPRSIAWPLVEANNRWSSSKKAQHGYFHFHCYHYYCYHYYYCYYYVDSSFLGVLVGWIWILAQDSIWSARPWIQFYFEYSQYPRSRGYRPNWSWKKRPLTATRPSSGFTVVSKIVDYSE
jgi:hypothetical protein